LNELTGKIYLFKKTSTYSNVSAAGIRGKGDGTGSIITIKQIAAKTRLVT
jgi:hypothetical protein